MKLIEICDFQGGSQPPKEEWSFEEKEGYIRMLQIRDFTQSDRVIPEYIKISNNTKICEANDILIARYGASIGKILTGLAGAYNVALMRTIPDTRKIKKKYLYYYLKSPYFQNAILNVGSRAAQAGFNKEDLSKLDIECPKLSEQENIVSILDKVEIIIEKRREELAFLDDLIKARFVELFGNPVLNEKGWESNLLAQLTLKIGSGATPKGGREAYQEEGIALIRSMNVYNGKFEYKDLAHISDEQAAKLDNVIIKESDVLLNITGASVARSCVVPNQILPARVNQHVCIIRCKECIEPIFLNRLLIDDNYQKLLWEIAGSGATREAITKQQVERLKIILPPIELQNQFADFVRQVDKSKLMFQKLHQKLNILRQKAGNI